MEIKTPWLSNSEKRGVGGNPLHETSAGGRSQLVTLIATLTWSTLISPSLKPTFQRKTREDNGSRSV